MILYPRLDLNADLVREAAELGRLSVDQCRARRAVGHQARYFSALGGVPATDAHLIEIADALTKIAVDHGYPENRGRLTGVDAHWSEFLHRRLDTTPNEAARDSMWHFFTIALVPDLVRWRWKESRDDSNSDRWVTVRHKGRNAFGRLWWRGEVLRAPDAGSPYHLVHALGEDELVQIMERASFAGNRLLSRTTATVLLAVQRTNRNANRGKVVREYQKRMLRLGAFTDFQSLDESKTRALALEVMQRTQRALKQVVDL